MSTIVVLSAFEAGRSDAAATLVFEYMAATQAETGRPVPSVVGGLPSVLRRECSDLEGVYRAPGVFLVAELCGRAVGCVGLAALPPARTAEVKRLYVRPAYRARGIARTLMEHAHHHAEQHGMTKLILDVLPARTAVIRFYRRLGYTETDPFETKSPVPMIYMERAFTTA